MDVVLLYGLGVVCKNSFSYIMLSILHNMDLRHICIKKKNSKTILNNKF